MQAIQKLILIAGLAVCISGQTKKLNNDDVLKMEKAGLDESTIVKAIESTPGEYDTSADGLIALKSGGASGAVLAAILSHGKQPAGSGSSAKSADGYPQELGVYFLKGGAYVPIEPEIMNARTTNALATAYSMGAKAMKINGSVSGQHSKTSLGSDVRVFFFDIAEGVAPAEFTLLRFDEKGDRREIELGKARFSTKTGVPEDRTIHFEPEKIDKGRYKITVGNLKTGEYAFLPPGAEVSRNSTSVGKVYTFQVTE